MQEQFSTQILLHPATPDLSFQSASEVQFKTLLQSGVKRGTFYKNITPIKTE